MRPAELIEKLESAAPEEDTMRPKTWQGECLARAKAATTKAKKRYWLERGGSMSRLEPKPKMVKPHRGPTRKQERAAEKNQKRLTKRVASVVAHSPLLQAMQKLEGGKKVVDTMGDADVAEVYQQEDARLVAAGVIPERKEPRQGQRRRYR